MKRHITFCICLLCIYSCTSDKGNYSLESLIPIPGSPGIGQYEIGMSLEEVQKISDGELNWTDGMMHTAGNHICFPSEIKRLYIQNPKLSQLPESCQEPLELFFYSDSLVCIFINHEYPKPKDISESKPDKRPGIIDITSDKSNKNTRTNSWNIGDVKAEFSRTDISAKKRENLKFSATESFSEHCMVYDPIGYSSFKEKFAETVNP